MPSDRNRDAKGGVGALPSVEMTGVAEGQSVIVYNVCVSDTTVCCLHSLCFETSLTKRVYLTYSYSTSLKRTSCTNVLSCCGFADLRRVYHKGPRGGNVDPTSIFILFLHLIVRALHDEIKSEVPSAAKMLTVVFWVTPRDCGGYQRFGGTSHLHLLGCSRQRFFKSKRCDD